MNEMGRKAEKQLEPKLSSPTLLRGFPSRVEVWTFFSGGVDRRSWSRAAARPHGGCTLHAEGGETEVGGGGPWRARVRPCR